MTTIQTIHFMIFYNEDPSYARTPINSHFAFTKMVHIGTDDKRALDMQFASSDVKNGTRMHQKCCPLNPAAVGRVV